MVDISHRIAVEVLSPSLFCILAIPGATGVRVVAGVAERHRDGVRIWLKNKRQADNVLAELLSWRAATRRVDAVVIAADIADVDQRLREAAALLGFPISEDDQVDAALSNLERRVEEAVKGGSAKLFARQYRRLRIAGWLLARLRNVLGRGIDHGFAWALAGNLSACFGGVSPAFSAP
jgi:hypothetical protein